MKFFTNILSSVLGGDFLWNDSRTFSKVLPFKQIKGNII